MQFKGMKSVTSLHRVAGYVKQEIEDEDVAERQAHATRMITKLKEILKKPLEDIRVHMKNQLRNLFQKNGVFVNKVRSATVNVSCLKDKWINLIRMANRSEATREKSGKLKKRTLTIFDFLESTGAKGSACREKKVYTKWM